MTGIGSFFALARTCLRLTAPSRRWRFALLGLLTLANSALEVVGVAAVLPFIAMVNDPALVLRHRHLARAYEALTLTDPRQFVVLCGVGFLVLVVVKNVLIYVQTRVQGTLLYGEAGRLGSWLFGNYLAMPYSQHLQTNSATNITTANHATDQVFSAVLFGLLGVLTEGLVMLGVVVVLLVAEPVVTLAAMVAVLAVAGPLHRSMRHHMEHFGRTNNDHYEGRLRILNQGFGSIKDLKVMGRESQIAARYAQLRQANATLLADNAARQQIPRCVMESLLVAGIVGTVVVALLQGRDTAAITAVLGLFAVAAFRLLPAVNRVLMHLNNIRQGVPSLERVLADMDRPSAAAQEHAEIGPPLTLTEALVLDDLRYAYPGGDKPVLNGVSLTVCRGEAVALVGASGAGKSTLADIMLGLLPPQAGRVLADGRDIAENMRSWRRHIGYVPQHIFIADDTVRRNVAYAVADDQIDEARVLRALALAQMTEVVAALPDGLDTMLGEHGTRLSGGQRQRIGLARALYDDPDLLILDEATSALDNETEFEVTRAIEGLRGAKTLIIIAHRLSTVRRCDRLALIDNGRVAAIGDYDALLETSPSFQSMVRHAGPSPIDASGNDHECLP